MSIPELVLDLYRHNLKPFLQVVNEYGLESGEDCPDLSICKMCDGGKAYFSAKKGDKEWHLVDEKYIDQYCYDTM